MRSPRRASDRRATPDTGTSETTRDGRRPPAPRGRGRRRRRRATRPPPCQAPGDRGFVRRSGRSSRSACPTRNRPCQPDGRTDHRDGRRPRDLRGVGHRAHQSILSLRVSRGPRLPCPAAPAGPDAHRTLDLRRHPPSLLTARHRRQPHGLRIPARSPGPRRRPQTDAHQKAGLWPQGLGPRWGPA